EAYFPERTFQKGYKGISLFIIAGALVLYATHMERLYTAVNSLFLALALSIILMSSRSQFLGRFFITYLILLVPFAIFNGYLTSLPVVIYNDAENMGIRLGTIPADDLLYNMGMLLIPIGAYARRSGK
ncbi:MAG: lycopene cyclase domain-containing protein, partial [Bacteroidota bacterium]|nr:lycopene cyclase domain-containing protein [Bacteroidota bacterium]MDX5430843.1 lycopene cyclase domain-containing protein [Bacteroidota bacterium]MDX5469587.1 lycopene cyclase domain-containing protein [Bacteroidota bacterium]